MEQVSEAYERVIFDTSPLLPVADTLEMLPSVDGIIVCARANRTTQDDASAVSQAFSRFPERPTGVVLTGIKRGAAGEAYVYSNKYS